MPFSLIDDPWIPAITASGKTHWLRPHEIATPIDGSLPVDCDWGRPDLRIATYELLIGLFGTALNLDHADDWSPLIGTPPAPEQLKASLAPLRPYFTLDGENPRFLQDLELLKGETLAVDALFMDAPGGNTLKNGADIFVHRERHPVLSRRAAAVALYALQAFAPSGGAGHRTSMRGGGPLTTLVVPHEPTLWSRVAANLPVLTEWDHQRPEDLSRVFPWAARTLGSKDGQVVHQEDPRTHWLQHFFGMPRRTRLIFAPNNSRRPCSLTGSIDETIVIGVEMQTYGVNYGVWRHSLSPYYQDKSKQFLPLHPRSSRAGWRDWLAWLFDGEATRAAAVVSNARNMDWARGSRLLAAGYVTDNMKTLDYVEAEVPLIVIEDDAPDVDGKTSLDRLRDYLRGRVEAAEYVITFLRSGLVAALKPKADSGPDREKAKASTTSAVEGYVDLFWIVTEPAFRNLLGTLAADPARRLDDALTEAWRRTLRAAALDIFDQAAPADILPDLQPAAQRRIIEARKALVLMLEGYGKTGRKFFEGLGLQPPGGEKRDD